MSAPVTTASDFFSIYDLLGGGAWIPQTPISGAVDQAGIWVYLADSSNGVNQSARIVRFNLQTNAVEIWLATGTLPVDVRGLCFTPDFSAFLFTSPALSPPHLYSLDFTTKAETDLGALGGSGVVIDVIRRIPAGGYLTYRTGDKDLGLLTIASNIPTLTEDAWRDIGWTCPPDIFSYMVYRCVQGGGPGTNGPLIRHRTGKPTLTEILAGQLGGGTDVAGVAAALANFSADSMAINDDASVVYFCSQTILYKLYQGNVTQVGTDPRQIVAYSAPLNRLLTVWSSSLKVWS